MKPPQNSPDIELFLLSNSTPSKFLNNISIFITILLVISLPIFYIFLLHIPPSELFKDDTFWFLLSNSIIIIIVAIDSDAFSSNPDTDTDQDIYDEFRIQSITRKQDLIDISPIKKPLMLSRGEEGKPEERRKAVFIAESVKNEGLDFFEEHEPLEYYVRVESKETIGKGCDYLSMSDEELNKRVEEFIRLNKKIMLQETSIRDLR